MSYEDNHSWNYVGFSSSSSNSNTDDIDYMGHFVEAEKQSWDTLEGMKEDLNEIAADLGFFLSIRRSNPNGGLRDPYAEIRCECSGTYRREGKPTSTRSGTKKCNCPFMIKGYVAGDCWKCYVENGVHNHPPTTYLEGHARAARLKTHEVEMVKALRKTSCSARAILEAIQEQDEDNVSNVKIIHNCISSLRLKETEGRNNIQQLMKMLTDEGYVFDFDKDERTDTLESLFFANPGSISLFKAFPDVMLMDCTHKSNRFNLPFLEVVGVASTNQSFCIGFVFMRAETTENYIWALQRLRYVFSGCVLPRVIVTDRDMALMNALCVVFPESHHLLCTFHIGKNMVKNCRGVIPANSWEKFTEGWVLMIECETISEYNQHVTDFFDTYTDYPVVIEYVSELLNDYNHKFVACFTNHTTHLGNKTTNRVEGQHASLKKYIKTSLGNLETVWFHVHKILKKQFITIKRELERCKSHFPHEYQIPVFKYLRSSVSHSALEHIFEQLKKCDGQYGHSCGCGIKSSHGLPCHHDLSMHNSLGQPLLPEAIHRFWRKIDVLDEVENNEDDGIDGALNEFKTVYSTKRPAEKSRMKKQLLDISVPCRTSMNEPEVRQTKGRPSKKGDSSTKRDKSGWEYVEEEAARQSTSLKNKGKGKTPINDQPTRPIIRPPPPPQPIKYIDQIYLLYHPYIERVDDVAGDGHCGYRVVAKAVGKERGADDWFEVRKDLYNELERNADRFYEFFQTMQGFKVVASSLVWNNNKTPPSTKWLKLPKMGCLIASCYNVPVISLHSQTGMSSTFLSCYSVPSEGCAPIIMVNVNNYHYAHVIPKRRFPMPTIYNYWNRLRSEEALDWLTYCRQHLNFHKALEKRDPNTIRTQLTTDDVFNCPDDSD